MLPDARVLSGARMRGKMAGKCVWRLDGRVSFLHDFIQ